MADIKIDLELLVTMTTTLAEVQAEKAGELIPLKYRAVELFEKYMSLPLQKEPRDRARIGIEACKAIASKLEQFLGDKQANKVTELGSRKGYGSAKWAGVSLEFKTSKIPICTTSRACWDWA